MPLDTLTKKRYIAEFVKLRRIDAPYTNWLLFSSTIESFIAKAEADPRFSSLQWADRFDEYRVNSACRKMEEWYVGDGLLTVPVSPSIITVPMSSIQCIWKL